MKVIFLDIDGVLATRSTKWQSFHPDCVLALKKVLDVTGAVIVLSSSWRHGFIDWRKDGHPLVHHSQVLTVMREWFKECGLPPERLIDKTPTARTDRRGDEIDKWLKGRTDVERFVILDDDTDMGEHITRLVITHGENGMNEKNADDAIKFLTGNMQ